MCGSVSDTHGVEHCKKLRAPWEEPSFMDAAEHFTFETDTPVEQRVTRSRDLRLDHAGR